MYSLKLDVLVALREVGDVVVTETASTKEYDLLVKQAGTHDSIFTRGWVIGYLTNCLEHEENAWVFVPESIKDYIDELLEDYRLEVNYFRHEWGSKVTNRFQANFYSLGVYF